MIYRAFGNTGEQISTLGFGCMRLPEVEKDGRFTVDQEKTNVMLRRAYELGVNYFDSGYTYCHGNSEAAVGEAVRPFRDKVLVSTKCPMEKIDSLAAYREQLFRSLDNLKMEYVDFYHFWGINRQIFDDKIMKHGLVEEALRLKEEGRIRHISFSFHDEPSAIKHILDSAPQLETMLAQYNLLDRANEEMFAYAASKGVGVVVMGPVGGGRLAAPTALYQKLTGREGLATYELALRFVLGNPNVCCALSGMETVEMVEQNAAVASDAAPMTPEEWKQIGEAMENLQRFNELYCTGCNYCQPCPKGINIPRIFQAYTYHNVYGLDKAAKKWYEEYVKGYDKPGATSKECVDCGACEKKCPQKLQIREELRRVEGILEAL